MAGPFVGTSTKVQVETTPGGGTFTDITDAINWTGPESTAPQIDVTNMDDSSGRQYKPGIVDQGTVAVSFHFDPENTNHQQLRSDQVAEPPTERLYRIQYPVGAPNNHYDEFNASVETASTSGGLDTPALLNLTLRVTGAVTPGTLP